MAKSLKRIIQETYDKRMKLATSFLLALIVLFFIFQSSYNTIQEIPIDVKVISTNRIGIIIDTDALHFGSIYHGNSGSRSIVVQNLDDTANSYLLVPEGDLASWVSLSESKFSLKPGESKDIEVVLNTPRGTLGEYEGTLVIRARSSFLDI